MTIIKCLVFIRACGAIEPCIFVASFLTMFPTAVSSMDSTFQRHMFLQNMESFRTIGRKGIWLIGRGGQGTNRVFRGNINGSLEHIWGISGSLMQGGSIINGDGRYIYSWATTIHFKYIIEAVINCPVVLIQCWNFLFLVSLIFILMFLFAPLFVLTCFGSLRD